MVVVVVVRKKKKRRKCRKAGLVTAEFCWRKLSYSRERETVVRRGEVQV